MPKLWNAGKKPSIESWRVQPRTVRPLRWLLRMFEWVSGTALGAFSEPLVNSTTAG